MMTDRHVPAFGQQFAVCDQHSTDWHFAAGFSPGGQQHGMSHPALIFLLLCRVNRWLFRQRLRACGLCHDGLKFATLRHLVLSPAYRGDIMPQSDD